MASCWKCDKCGGYFETPRNHVLRLYENLARYSDECFDLCDECQKQFYEWVDRPGAEDRVTEDSIDKWLREFQLAHGESVRELAFALHNDIPLGYEASMRLGQWLLNATQGAGECESNPDGLTISISGDGTLLNWRGENYVLQSITRDVNRKPDGDAEICSDDRFELIAKARQELLDATNIDSRPDEIAVLDNILFRCWQMGWLDQLRVTAELDYIEDKSRWYELFGTPEKAARTIADISERVNLDGIGGDYAALLEWLEEDGE